MWRPLQLIMQRALEGEEETQWPNRQSQQSRGEKYSLSAPEPFLNVTTVKLK